MSKQIGRGPVMIGATNVGVSDWKRTPKPTFEEVTDTESPVNAIVGAVCEQKQVTAIGWDYSFKAKMKAGVDPGSIGLIAGCQVASVKLMVGETVDFYGCAIFTVEKCDVASAAKGVITYDVSGSVDGDENGTLH